MTTARVTVTIEYPINLENYHVSDPYSAVKHDENAYNENPDMVLELLANSDYKLNISVVTPPTPQHSAYLIFWISGNQVIGIDIYSSEPWNLTTLGNRLPTLLYKITDTSYHNAHEKMVDMIKSLPDNHTIKQTWFKHHT